MRAAITPPMFPGVASYLGESRRDRFIESLHRKVYGVLNVSKIPDGNRARSKNHAFPSIP